MPLLRLLSLWLKPGRPAPPIFDGPDGALLLNRLPPKTRRAFARHSINPEPDPAAHDAGSRELLAHLRGLPHSLLTAEDWLLGFRQMVSRGAFRLGGAFRDKAVSRSLSDAESLPATEESLVTGICAAIDQAQFDLAQHFLNRLADLEHVDPGARHRLVAWLALHQGRLSDFHTLTPPPDGPPDGAFFDCIQGRSVAMVGPAAPVAAQGSEIDGFDVIARSNHRGAETPYDPETLGSRTDISFYAYDNLRELESAGQTHRFAEWLDTIDWAVLKTIDFSFQRNLLPTGKIALRRWNQLYFHGHPNLTPSNLHTLLSFRARRVKVFNSNLYSGSTPYAQGYTTSLDRAVMFDSMAGHDCVSQLNFMRNLHRAGLVELDPECLAVVSLSSDAYLAGLERIFVNPTIAPPLDPVRS